MNTNMSHGGAWKTWGVVIFVSLLVGGMWYANATDSSIHFVSDSEQSPSASVAAENGSAYISDSDSNSSTGSELKTQSSSNNSSSSNTENQAEQYAEDKFGAPIDLDINKEKMSANISVNVGNLGVSMKDFSLSGPGSVTLSGEAIEKSTGGALSTGLCIAGITGNSDTVQMDVDDKNNSVKTTFNDTESPNSTTSSSTNPQDILDRCAG